MEKITKKVLLEEINKINKMMGLPPKQTLNEQISKVAGELAPKFGEFIKKLVSGGEKEVEGLAKEFENPNFKLNNGKVIADEIRYVGEKLAQGKSLSALEERFTTDVLEKLYPGVEKSIQKSLEDTIITMEGGPSMLSELERIMKDPKYSSEQISKILSDDLGIQGVSQVEVGLWRSSLSGKQNVGGIRVPKRTGMGSEPRTELPKGEPESISKPIELNPQETKMVDDIITAGSAKVTRPESVGVLNSEVTEILDTVPVGGEAQFLEDYAQKQGVPEIDGNRLYELANKVAETNQELVGALKQQSETIAKAMEERISSGGSKPPTGGGEPPLPTGGGTPPKPKKSWFRRGEKTPKLGDFRTAQEIYITNLKHTAFQLAMIGIDIFANGKEMKNYQQPMTGLFSSEIVYTKLAATAIDQVLYSLKFTAGGKVLIFLNTALSGIDLVSTGVGLSQSHKPKIDQSKIDAENEKKRKISSDSLKNSLIDQGKKLRNDLSIDSLKRKVDSLNVTKKVDSLKNAIDNRLNPTNKLDTGGTKEVLVDPFKKKN
jgi:hypothetical protein